ncbi:MAG TPA: GNAT family N-acetyltransferase, partial [Rhodothermales bacterium]|nr:GNAT family N-acetyltransferase [Rhodothermales bacterium]
MSKSQEWCIRPTTRPDLPFLRRMLWAAAFWQEPSEDAYPDEDLERHDLAFLLEDWGRPGDTGVVAESEAGESVGAAWYRLWTEDRHFYGYVSPEIPELGIAVAGHARGRGIGTRLMDELLRVAAENDLEAVS